MALDTILNSKLILGTVQMGLPYGINNTIGKVPLDNSLKILDYAFNNGIRTLDSAEAYGDSHEVIGNYHNKFNNSFKVISKFSSKRLDLPNNLIERVHENLHTLNVKSLYSYMFHTFNDLKINYNNFKEDLLYLKNLNKINKIGVSIYTNEELEEVLKYEDIGLIQIPFNLFDNSFHRKEILLKAKSKGVEVHVRSAFLQGLFFKDINTIKGKMLPLKPYLIQLEDIKNKYNINTETLALKYVLQKDYIDNVLIGVDSITQLKKNIEICSKDIDIPKSSIDEINVKNNNLLNPLSWI